LLVFVHDLADFVRRLFAVTTRRALLTSRSGGCATRSALAAGACRC
jgi:hypothetical protein